MRPSGAWLRQGGCQREIAAKIIDKEADYDLTFEQRYTRYPPFRPAAEDTDVKAALEVSLEFVRKLEGYVKRVPDALK